MRKLTGRGLKTLSARPMSSKWLELRCEPRFTWLWTLQSFMCIILATEGWKESALDLLSLLFLANTRQSSFSYTGGEAVVQIDLLMSCLLRCFSCLTLCNPMDCSPPGSSVHGILQARTLEWVSFPSPIHESEKSKWSGSVVSNSLRPHGLQPTRLLRPWDFPGKSIRVGCHCLLLRHCKSEILEWVLASQFLTWDFFFFLVILLILQTRVRRKKEKKKKNT